MNRISNWLNEFSICVPPGISSRNYSLDSPGIPDGVYIEITVQFPTAILPWISAKFFTMINPRMFLKIPPNIFPKILPEE